MDMKGSVYRIRKCAFDLLSVWSDLMDDDESWDLMRRDIQLKSTFLYLDFNKVISGAPQDQKKPLTELANKLFCSIEELDHAVKLRSMKLTRDQYNEAACVLEEVIALEPPGT